MFHFTIVKISTIKGQRAENGFVFSKCPCCPKKGSFLGIFKTGKTLLTQEV
jgi:hypothetical protein